MPKLNEWLLELADGENIEAVVLGEMGWGDYGHDHIKDYAQQPRGTVLTWPEALPWISYEFDDSFGAPNCNGVVAWTKSWVISVYQYDGSTSPFRMPRNPTAHLPEMPGG